MNLPLRQKKIMKKLFYTGPRNCALTCGALFWPCMHRNALVRNFFRKLQSGAKWWRKEKTKVPNWEVMWRQVTVWRRKNVNMYRHHSHTPIICEINFMPNISQYFLPTTCPYFYIRSTACTLLFYLAIIPIVRWGKKAWTSCSVWKMKEVILTFTNFPKND